MTSVHEMSSHLVAGKQVGLVDGGERRTTYR